MYCIDKTAVVASCEAVMRDTQFVSLGSEIQFEGAAETFVSAMCLPLHACDPSWTHNRLHPRVFNDDAINWIFVCDLLNFSFWQDEPMETQFSVSFGGQSYTGYWSLCAALNRAIYEDKMPVTDPVNYASLSQPAFAHLFRSDNPRAPDAQLPLASERHRLLVESGRVLRDKYCGSFACFLRTCSDSVWHFVSRLVSEFPSFHDCHHGVWLLKRAQILAADLWSCSNGQLFPDIAALTIFADYR